MNFSANNSIFKGLCAIAALITPTISSAETVNNVKVLRVGNQGGQLYAYISVNLAPCNSTIVYHSSETQAGQYVMSILLSAKLAQMPISRMDYHINSSGTCWIDLVEI